jgi:hypothetical protein
LDFTSSERVAYTFPLIAATHVDTDVDEGSETGGDTLGTTVPNVIKSWIKNPVLRSSATLRDICATQPQDKGGNQNDGILKMVCCTSANRMIAGHHI